MVIKKHMTAKERVWHMSKVSKLFPSHLQAVRQETYAQKTVSDGTASVNTLLMSASPPHRPARQCYTAPGMAIEDAVSSRHPSRLSWGRSSCCCARSVWKRRRSTSKRRRGKRRAGGKSEVEGEDGTGGGSGRGGGGGGNRRGGSWGEGGQTHPSCSCCRKLGGPPSARSIADEEEQE
eukprot:764625-Hanusia_phi.AAC.7